MGRFLGDAKGAPVSKEGMTLIWSPESIHDLIALRAHIAEQDPAAAKRVALHILYCVEYLLLHRLIGVRFVCGRFIGEPALYFPARHE